MKKVIKCPATESKRGICTCNVKCTSSYDKNGNRIKVRKSLPYLGIARRVLNGESIENIIKDIDNVMKKSKFDNQQYLNKYGKEIPDKNASEEEIWTYALSFSGYEWVNDKYKKGEFADLVVDENNKKFLDYTHPGWRNHEGEPSAVLLIGCIGGGKSAEECSVEELKAVLFWEQRGNRWSQDWPDDSLTYARDLIKEIKKKSTNTKERIK